MLTRRLFVAVMLGIVLCLPRVAAGEESRERWFVIEMMGSRAGWMHTAVRTEEERIVSTDKMLLSLNRADTPITIELTTEWIETPRGEPVSARVAQTFGGQLSVTT